MNKDNTRWIDFGSSRSSDRLEVRLRSDNSSPYYKKSLLITDRKEWNVLFDDLKSLGIDVDKIRKKREREEAWW